MSKENMTKSERCKYAFLDFKKSKDDHKYYKCYKKDCNGNPIKIVNIFNAKDEEVLTVDKNNCETCEYFKSKFIEYPLTIQGIESKYWENIWKDAKKSFGKYVKIRPCDEKYENKTYLGILLGEMPYAPNITFSENSGELEITPRTNPCIFVPELNEFIWGMESWWGVIKNPEEIKEITNEDIDNIWYVQLLKNMYLPKENNDKKE